MIENKELLENKQSYMVCISLIQLTDYSNPAEFEQIGRKGGKARYNSSSREDQFKSRERYW